MKKSGPLKLYDFIRKGKTRKNTWKIAWGLLFLSLGLPACTLYSPGTASQAVVKGCVVPSDQQGTFSGKWPLTPIPVALSQGEFNSSETTAITAAMDTWNTFYTASSGLTQVFHYGSSSSSPNTSSVTDSSQSSYPCESGIVGNNQFIGNVVVYKLYTWPSSYAPSAMAQTSYCFQTASPFNRIYLAVIEINYQNFFVNNNKVPDLQSIITHEFGHLLGLGHSCEMTQKTGFPNCLESNLNPDYLAAIMFPTFSFDQNGNGIQKRSLGNDDEGRANCLYQGSGTTASPTP